MNRFTGWLGCACLLLVASCSVKTLDAPAGEQPAANSCARDSDCMAGATCRAGACFAATSAIDQIVVEVVPAADSPSGGLAYVLTLDDVAHGGTRDIALPDLAPFVMQVALNADDAAACKLTGPGPVTLPARVEFTRSASVDGAPIIGLPSMPLVAVTAKNGAAWSTPLSLVPGSYDIYIQPSPVNDCDVAPRLLRAQQVDETVDPSKAPATLELPKAKVLGGTM